MQHKTKLRKEAYAILIAFILCHYYYYTRSDIDLWKKGKIPINREASSNNYKVNLKLER